MLAARRDGGEATPLVGREAEIAALAAALDAARRGAGGLLLVAGEAGIGKTRLCEALDARARAAGFAVCWALAARDGAAGPSPWPQVARAIARRGADPAAPLDGAAA